MDIKSIKRILPALGKSGLVANLIGFHGLGKSSVVEMFSKEIGYSFHPLFLGQMGDQGDVLGLPEFMRNEKGIATSVKFIHPDLLPREPKSVLFLDELSHAPKEIRGLLFQLILTGQMADYTLPKDSIIITAMNPDTSDYPATLDFSNKAFGDRFVHIKFSPTVEEFYQYMGEKYGQDDDTLAFLREQPKLVEEQNLESFNLDFVKPSRRSWDRVSKLLKQDDFPVDLRMETLIGMVGTEAAIAYASFLETRTKTVTALDVLNDFSSHKQKIKSYFEGDVVRSDILSNIATDLLDQCEIGIKEGKSFTSQTYQNIIEFYLLVPKEVSFAALVSTKNRPTLLLDESFTKNVFLDPKLNAFIDQFKNTKTTV